MLLGCQYSAWILFVGMALVLAKPPTNLPRQYRIQQHYESIWNNGGYSITDLSEEEVYYKIEPRFHFGQRVEVFRYPEKKKTAKLRTTLHLSGDYRAKIDILNETTNRFVSGEVKQTPWWDRHSFTTRWNGHDFKLNEAEGYRTFAFQDKNNEVLAEYFAHTNLRYWRTFNMTIYSNKYPEELYILSFTAHAALSLRTLLSHYGGGKGYQRWTKKHDFCPNTPISCDIPLFINDQ